MKRKGGFGKVKEMHKRQQESRGSSDFIPRLIMQDAETALSYFSGSTEEPEIIMRHYQPRGRKFGDCREDKKCVGCYYEEKDGSIGKPQAVACFNVIDTRWFHKIETQVRGRTKKEYVECPDDRSCKQCQTKDGKKDRYRKGRCIAYFALTWADALGAQDEKLSKKCGSCKRGKIRVVDYQCPECNESIDWAPDEDDEKMKIRCGECRAKIEPDEVIECTKCDAPVRATIFDYGCPVEITRSGTGTSTSYNFTPVWPPPEEAPDWIFEEDQEPFDLEEACAKPTSEEQAKLWEVVNPFNKKDRKEYEEYDDDDDKAFDDDDGDDDDDDDDGDSTPF